MPDWLTAARSVPLWLEAAPKIAFYLWVAAVGGCLGSFFNVVLYRVPRGEGIVWRGSHCPECDCPIRARHNLPVIGWLLLGGRCYDCKAAISVVYPAVELLFAVAAPAAVWLICG